MVAPVDPFETGLGCGLHSPASTRQVEGLELPGVSRRSGATTLCRELNIAYMVIVVRLRCLFKVFQLKTTILRSKHC